MRKFTSFLNISKTANSFKSLKATPLKWRSTAVIAEKTLDDNGLFRSTTKQRTISFDDPQIAYRCKSTRELLRAYLVFRLCSISFLVDHQYKVGIGNSSTMQNNSKHLKRCYMKLHLPNLPVLSKF